MLLERLKLMTDDLLNILGRFTHSTEVGDIGTVISEPDGTYLMPFYKAKMDNGKRILFVSNETLKIDDRIEIYSMKKREDGYLLFGKKTQK